MPRKIPLSPDEYLAKRTFRRSMGMLTAERNLTNAILGEQGCFLRTAHLEILAARSDFDCSTRQKRIGIKEYLLRAESERRVEFSQVENCSV